MGSSLLRESSLSGDNCKYLCNSEYEELCNENEDCDCRTELEALQNLRIHNKDNFVIKKLEDDFSDILDFSGSDECLSNNKPSISQDEPRDEANSEEKYQVICALKEHNSESEEEEYSPSSISVEGLLNASVHAGISPEPEIKLISAMKGSRAQHGLATNTKLSVKWAPDVYDPPPTAESHTLKGHHRHSNLTRKDYYKQKHSRSSSSRSHSSDKKQSSRRSSKTSHHSSRSSTDPRISSLKALNEGVLARSSSGPRVGVLYALKMKELTCGGIRFNESIASVHFLAGAS